ncbi:hypothetical protein AURDEDRAFT_110298 [Auricularia subglabra TFB-10046 SS5]|nr:hypothetical protein AURDEDRAFT_110298 [Auricularia subglabra TFB-10046 SS5]
MFDSIPGLDSFILVLVLLVGPWVLSEIRRLRRQARQPQSQTGAANAVPLRHRWWLMLLVAAHSVYILHKVTMHPPLNIFTALRVPLTTPAATLRKMLLQQAQPPSETLPQPLEELLIKLSSFDVRTLYIRLGHATIQGCEHCATPDEYQLVALPRPVLEFVREALFAGLLTSRALHKRHWRPWAVGVLAVFLLFERYVLATIHIKLPSHGLGVTMVHDRLWYWRQTLFFFVPIALYVLPARTPGVSAVDHIAATTQSLNHIIRNSQMLELNRAAALRTPLLREQLTDHWAGEQQAGDWARNDPAVRAEAEKVDMSVDVLRDKARGVARTLFSQLPGRP